MITKVSKSKRVRPITALLALAIPATLALVLGLAALALVIPAGASAQTLDANTTGKLYELYDNEGCDPQLYVSEPKAAKPDGEKEALDLSVELTDDYGNPIEGAKVMARVTDFETFVDAPLTDLGNGTYSACAFGYFNGSGEGAVRIHVRAEKADYRPGASDGSNSVGRICAVSGSGPSR